jgi:NAD(P)-dependent dehydrogenase (short-subunit alcohol dehydrogenase family)
MHPNIENKVAVITGGSRGIGFAIAGALIENGAKVLIGSRSEVDVQSATESLNRLTPARHAKGKTVDVRDYQQVEQFMATAEREFGGIDILVNNAGIGMFHMVDNMPPEEWEAVIQTNLSGVFYCIRAAVGSMKRRGGGYIFNISSLAGKNAFAGGAAYNASKFGLNGLSEAAMLDLRYHNIRVSYIMPGSVETDFGSIGRKKPDPESWKIASKDVAETVVDLLKIDSRAMLSRVEMRPSKPPRK